MDVYIEEIAGDVAQQKAVAALAAKNKEARSSKACDMLELIGKQVTRRPTPNCKTEIQLQFNPMCRYCTVADIRQVSLTALAKTARKSVSAADPRTLNPIFTTDFVLFICWCAQVSVRLRVAIEELLRRLVIGLSHSCTVQPKDVLTLAYTLLDECVFARMHAEILQLNSCFILPFQIRLHPHGQAALSVRRGWRGLGRSGGHGQRAAALARPAPKV